MNRKKLILALSVIFAVNILLITVVQSASAEVYRRGSSGDTVREIQTRLKKWQRSIVQYVRPRATLTQNIMIQNVSGKNISWRM